jgi:hypothetical protein
MKGRNPMRDQTAFGISTQKWDIKNIVISKEDRIVLRKLAYRVLELAERPVEKEKMKLWYKHNMLEATRPLIFCDPENGWNEIITEDQFTCEGELAKHWENILRKEIFWGESMGDDRVIESFFNVPFSYSETDWGMHETRQISGKNGSYTWDACLKNYKEIDKLHFPEITVDYESTEKIFDLAGETLGDILTVRMKAIWWWSIALTNTLIYLRGLEQSMLDMYDYPDEMHNLMAFIRDGYLAKLDFLEKNGLLSLNNDGTYVGSGGFGWTDELPQKDYNGGKVRTADMWGFCESQETTSVSPEMFEEFVYQYQLPFLERFGLNCYGCCEPLNKRWHIIEKSPGLRRVSVSPWANLKDMADKLGNRFVYSMKPNPADLALPNIDEDYIRKNLRKALQDTRNCRVEVIMKDNHTLGGNPQNIINWCKIAREEILSL